MSARQTVLVTGGASGIGLAIVEAVLAEGWRAIVADLDQTNLDRCRDALGASKGQVRFEPVNVADEEAVVRSVAACEDEFGPITGVVNSAGIARDVPALDTSAEMFRRILEVNLIGSFLISREAAKRMQARGSGSIVNITSVSGIKGERGSRSLRRLEGRCRRHDQGHGCRVGSAWHPGERDCAGSDRDPHGPAGAHARGADGLDGDCTAAALWLASGHRRSGGLPA